MKYVLFTYLGIVFIMSTITFFLFGIDKSRAIHYKDRIRERTLLFFIIMGGAIGGSLGSSIFHHKTRKNRFRIAFAVSLILEVLIFVGIMVLFSNVK